MLCVGMVVIGGGKTLEAQVALRDKIARAPEECSFEPSKMELRGRRLLSTASAPCDSLMMGEYLVLQAAVVRRKPWVEWDTVDCAGAPGLLVYARAANHHLLGQLEDAETLFLRCARMAESPRLSFYALQAAGTVSRERGDHAQAMAHLLAAYEGFPELGSHPLALLNLSAVAAMLEEWEDVLSWTHLAEQELDQRLEQDPHSPAVQPDWRALILANRLLACMRLGAVDEANHVFQRMPLHDLNVLEKWDVLGVVTGYLLSRNDGVAFEAHLQDLQSMADADSSATVQRLGVHATLYEPWRTAVWGDRPFHEVWEAVRALPAALGDRSGLDVDWAGGRTGNLGAGGLAPAGLQLHFWRVLVGVLGFLNIWALWLWLPRWWGRRQLQRQGTLVNWAEMARTGSWSESLRFPGKQMWLRWSIIDLMRQREGGRLLTRFPGWESMSERERAFLQFLANGNRSKEFARQHQLSAGYVYNMSSSIRRKMEVPEGMELSDWVRNQMEP